VSIPGSLERCFKLLETVLTSFATSLAAPKSSRAAFAASSLFLLIALLRSSWLRERFPRTAACSFVMAMFSICAINASRVRRRKRMPRILAWTITAAFFSCMKALTDLRNCRALHMRCNFLAALFSLCARFNAFRWVRSSRSF
jgi:hypothetical protein